MLKRLCTFLFVAIVLVSCGAKGETYRIGIDPSFYGAALVGKEAEIYAFSKELLCAISHEEGISFESVTTAWDNLIYGLKNDQYDAILSSISPRINLLKTYNFSDPFLYIGPVLVMKKDMKVSSVKHLRGKEISVESMNQEVLLIEKYPGVNVHYYYSIPEAFEEIVTGQIDGILIDYPQATSYIRNLYREKVRIATPPLNDLGLRLVTLNGEEKELVEAFNRGLDKLRDNGTYEKLLEKWELN
ncbi:MAG: transporter substrate-binding domain-containing protein [Candidatus Neptunochlamydia sp.]|nr:transporter substrate-binding domain-containing protein [Candidatus Neptunochlamydia sp.]